jgi:hypothetical protein
MANSFPEVHARIERALELTPLEFKKVPHWGWRAEALGHTFEIENLGRATSETHGDRFRAYVRKPRSWLEIQYVKLAGDARRAAEGRA